MPFIAPPKLPTDNLYKFVALFGLALLVLGTTLSVTASNRMDSETAKVSQLLTLDSLEPVHPTTVTIDSVFERTPHGAKFFKVLSSTDSGSVIDHQQRHQMDSALAELRGEQITLNPGRAFVESAALEMLGLILMAVGFWLWYERVQKLQDALLTLEVKQRRQADEGVGRASRPLSASHFE